MMFSQKKKSEFKTWHGILLVGMLVTAVILGVFQRLGTPKDPVPVIDVIVNQQTCGISGGEWNACASACRGMDPGVPCIEVCVAQCECKEDAQCPYGHSCEDKVEGKGICKQ